VAPADLGLLLLVGSDVLLAAAVFTLWGRPEQVLGGLCSLTGQRADWDAGRLGEADEQRLLRLAAGLRLPALFALFGWSVLVGSVLAAAGRITVPILPG
jgi:hypothetical protein